MWGLHYDLEGVSYLVPLLINRAVNYRLVVGGSHHLAHLFTKVLYRHGGMIISPVTVKRIVVENGAATGVELEDGTVYTAKKFVASSLDPYQTFLKYVGEEQPGGAFRYTDQRLEMGVFQSLPRASRSERASEFQGGRIQSRSERGLHYRARLRDPGEPYPPL